MTAIVGRDPVSGDLGVAVEWRTLAAGAVVPYARAGVGAIACAGISNSTYGPRGLDMLASGMPSEEVGAALIGADEGASRRQFAIVDAQGRGYTYTGEEVKRFSVGWTDGITRRDVALIGNSLIGEETLTLMADSFRRAGAPLWHQLMKALDAGQHIEGESRGAQQHSAALLVVREGSGYGGFDDRIVDLRVDDHPRPVEELERLLGIHLEHFLVTDAVDLVPLVPDLTREIQTRLALTGDYRGWIMGQWDAATREALERFAGRENLEERLQPDDLIDPKVLERLGVSDLWRLHLASQRERARRA